MTIHGVERARVKDALDRAERWLARTEIVSILMYADRMFLRAAVDGGVRARADAAQWIARADELLTAVDDDLRDDVDDTTSVLVIRWAFDTLGETALVARLDAMLARYMHQLPDLAEHWQEFERSTYFYWAERAGLSTRRTPGPPPNELKRRIYHDLHMLMIATDYGARPLAVDDVTDDVLVEALAYPERLANVRIRGENADLVAEALLVELALVPRRGIRVGTLLATLLEAQEADGSFAPTLTAPLDARHHTTCVSVGVFIRALALGT
jgi:hypothetical protein